jgi:uncharacterized protein (TIGR00106 family)
MALMQIAVIPLATPSTSLSPYIAALHRELQNAGATYRLTDMGTIIEGKVEKLWGIAAKLHQLPFEQGVSRVVTSIQIDDRRDKQVALGDKIDSVNRFLR